MPSVTIHTNQPVDWSYHRVIWKDMDGDGDLDALTARFNWPFVTAARTALVWLENPGLPLAETPSEGWNEHVMHDSYENGYQGPDVNF